jgi:ATP-binding cassette subfamily F protein uup
MAHSRGWPRGRARATSTPKRVDALEHAEGAAQTKWLEVMELASADLDRLGGWERSHEAERLLVSLGIRDLSQRVSTMSGGERRRVALARVLVARPDLAILDEPTNHLDVDAIEWLERYLGNEYVGANPPHHP